MPESAATDKPAGTSNSEAAEGTDESTGTAPRHTFELAVNQSADIASEIRKQVKFLREISGGGSFRQFGGR